MRRHEFRSDNVDGAAPELLQALIEASGGVAAPYGEDDWTRRLEQRCREVFEHDLRVFPLSTGTGSNVAALAAIDDAAGAIYCHESAHINVHEGGAAQFYCGGAPLVALPGAGYKLDPAGLAAALRQAITDAASRPPPAALNLTQPTDFGTLYTVGELHGLSAVARAHGLRVHMDGARFASAIAALGCSPADMTWRAGVDVLSLGATKNGAINAEAIVVFEPALAQKLPSLMKRGGLAVSKARFVSAQLERYLADGLWLQRAARANAHARALAAGLAAIDGVELVAPVEINMVFVRLPDAALQALRAGPFDFYELGGLQRFVCRHDQSPESIERLLECLYAAQA